MKPVAIFRHAPVEGPAYFAIFLERHGIPWRLVAIDEGEAVPATAEEFSGLCFMGGPMSVNDPLPWIEPACALIRDATVRARPVLCPAPAACSPAATAPTRCSRSARTWRCSATSR
jgi:hypothetical protein